MTAPTISRLPRWLLGSGIIATAMAVMNLSTYGFTILAARVLGPREYGALAALMGLLLVCNVVSLGLQAAGARRVSAAPKDRPAIEAEILSASYRSAVALGLLCLLAVPLVSWLLRLDSWSGPALLALAAAPLTVMGGQAGVLQGERRWLGLGAVYLAMGLGRLLGGATALTFQQETAAAKAGVAVGGFAPVIAGRLALARRRGADIEVDSGHSERPRSPESVVGILREVGHASHVLLAFFALSSIDVVVARVALDDYRSGLYAGGLILAKAVLFLPQFVTVVAFPSMAASGSRQHLHLTALVAVLGIGAAATVGASTWSGLAIAFIGGQAYAGLEPIIWVFAVVGTVLAMIQLMVYSVVARQHRRAVLALWAGLVVVAGLGPVADSVRFLVTGVVLVDACVLVVLLLASPRKPAGPAGFVA